MQGRHKGKKLRLLVVEDDGLWRDMFRLALSAQPRLELVDIKSSGEELLPLCRSVRPDVLLIDLDSAATKECVGAARAGKAERPEMGVVVIAAAADRECLAALPSPDTPGWSLIVKQSLSDMSALVHAIEAAAAGLVVLDPALLAATLEPRHSRLSRLTPRQLEVLQLMAKGLSNSAIAKALVLEEKSVENHINAIFSQLVVNHDASAHPRVKAVITYLEETGAHPSRAA
ncbi:MAG: response regulator transcription factor [Dehalococcoidia bacterium]|nr:response regulator transcription factor [Dehalococcoidia bacterium]